MLRLETFVFIFISVFLELYIFTICKGKQTKKLPRQKEKFIEHLSPMDLNSMLIQSVEKLTYITHTKAVILSRRKADPNGEVELIVKTFPIVKNTE